jgi:aminoglycoside phosphotransferase family enzyme/predicted kinase
VVPITGLPDAPQLGGAGAVLDYAVRMREFPQRMLLSAMLDRQEVDERRIDELAAEVARFHGRIDVAPPGSPYGDAKDALALALDNIDALLATRPDPAIAGTLDTLRRWTERTFASIQSRLEARRREGFVRECHGDLHLGNIAVVDGRIAIFDCIDFNARMRWNDLMGEVAFLAMDLEYRGRADLADRFVNRYMEATGDYAGAAVLRFFVVYRAMVRAKVEALRVAQMPDGAERAWLATECREYVALARAWAAPPHPAMVAMHGLSGSGKTTVSDAITAPLGALRVRTDVERKRLHGLAPTAASGSGTQSGLYAEDATRAAYHRVLDLAHEAIAGGFTVVADGAFLHRWQRELFRSAAASLGAPFAILSVRGRQATLERRIAARARASTDASEADAAVLAHQRLAAEPLADDEAPRVVVWNGERPVATLRSSPDWARLVALIGDPEAARAGPEHPGIPVGQEAVVLFLSRPSSHADGGTLVETIETHWSWVFVTGNRAIKIKKAIRTEFADLRRVTARRRNCAEEVRLNRRLSHDVYLGTRPLLADAGGRVSFSTGAQAVDWAVEMRRLAPERMLDRLIADGEVRAADVTALVARLVAFYRDARRHDADVEAYRERLVGSVHANRDELTRPEYGLPVERIERICARQLDVLAARPWLDARRGALVEGHGDLRPEHVCLDGEPQVIDCLDFSRALRTQDAVDDLGFLALECARLGAPSIGAAILDGYRHASGDDAPPAVVRFYQGLRACVRARLAIRHLREPALARNPLWRERAEAYLAIAQQLVEDGGMP